MRTHIRMHFDKKTNDFNEENYISCTLDEESTDAQTPIISLSNQALSPENPAAVVAQTHHCDKCSYSSNFKGNLVSVNLMQCIHFV